MKIVEYNNATDIIVEFQDKYKARVRATYQSFQKGQIKNPYRPSICGVGIIGNKYPISIDGEPTKEYKMWIGMMSRSFKKAYKTQFQTYNNVTCCDEWLLFENFYEWLHSQENFDKWLNKKSRWCLDKDILIKHNQIYSPNTCVIVPERVNNLFIKSNANRGTLPIGVSISGKKYKVVYHNPHTNKTEYLGVYDTPEEAFKVYKKRKEEIIQQIAQNEYLKGNISKKCFDAMMNYQVEIND